MSKRNICCVIVIMFVGGVGFSQNYQPFPLSNAAWKEYHIRIYGSSNTDEIRIQHEIGVDTIINGVNYKKILKTGRFNNYQTGTIYYNNEYVGAIREDSSKRVFFMKKNPMQNSYYMILTLMLVIHYLLCMECFRE